MITSQEYLIGTIRPDGLFPRHQLASSGTEGSAEEKQTPVRSVIGGTGMFDGARGTVRQRFQGTNTTVLAGIGTRLPTPLRLLAPLTGTVSRPRADPLAVRAAARW